MRKITLAKRPSNFKYTIKGALPDGDTFAPITVSYIYREQTEFFAWQDALAKRDEAAYQAARDKKRAEAIKAGASPEEAEHVAIGATEIGEIAVQLSADKLMETIDGWDGIDGDFDAENVHILCNRYPSVAAAIHGSYQRALVEGKRGN